MNDILYAFPIIFCLIIWFNTEAFVEYFRYIPILNKKFYIKMYLATKDKMIDLKYLDFIVMEKNCFFTRLISCPLCLNTWLNIFCLPFYSKFIYFFINFIISITAYYAIILLKKKNYAE